MNELTHFDEKGNTRMVDVGGKPETLRIAIAQGHVTAHPETLHRIAEKQMQKGNVLEVAPPRWVHGSKTHKRAHTAVSPA